MGQCWSGTVLGWPRDIISLQSKPNALRAAVCCQALSGVAFATFTQSKQIIPAVEHQSWEWNRKVGWLNPCVFSEEQCLGFEQHGYTQSCHCFLPLPGKGNVPGLELQWLFWRLIRVKENKPLGLSTFPAISLQAEVPFSRALLCDLLIKDNLGPRHWADPVLQHFERAAHSRRKLLLHLHFSFTTPTSHLAQQCCLPTEPEQSHYSYRFSYSRLLFCLASFYLSKALKHFWDVPGFPGSLFARPAISPNWSQITDVPHAGLWYSDLSNTTFELTSAFPRGHLLKSPELESGQKGTFGSFHCTSRKEWKKTKPQDNLRAP